MGGVEMLSLQKLGRMSLQEVNRRQPFMSFVVCRDDRNQLCIVGCRTPYFVNYALPYVQAEIVDKVHISKAIIKAYSRGRMTPNENDMYNRHPVRFRVVVIEDLRPDQFVDAYMLS
jgi:hypothetical protein